jgi:hypothetical protein
MALVLGLRVGDTVQVGGQWIGLAAVEGPHAIRIWTSDGDSVRLGDKGEIEVFPEIWIGLGPLPTGQRIRLTFDAPTTVKIGRRRKSD